MRNWDKTGPSSSPKFSFCSSPPHPEHSRGKREHRKGSSSHWGHRLGLSPYLSPLCLHPAAHRPRIQVCKATPPFPEAQPPQPGSVGEKRGRWLNITCTHATPAPAPRANIPAWCPRPGQLHQKAEETGCCGWLSMGPQPALSAFPHQPGKTFTGMCTGGFGG